MKNLHELGFKSVGYWRLENDMPVCDLTDLTTCKNILYSFVVNGEVKYIGKTTQQLRKRMYGYQNPAKSQTTNIKNHNNIKNELKKGNSVDVLAFADNGLLHLKDYHINIAAGLEDSLIKKLSPNWNFGGTKSDIIVPQNNHRTSGLLATDRVSLTQIFSKVLHKTYWSSGFFNVPVSHQQFFGKDLEQIEICCDTREASIIGHINRKANKNATPRIMGGVSLKNWFQEGIQHDRIEVEIFSPTKIALRRIKS